MSRDPRPLPGSSPLAYCLPRMRVGMLAAFAAAASAVRQNQAPDSATVGTWVGVAVAVVGILVAVVIALWQDQRSQRREEMTVWRQDSEAAPPAREYLAGMSLAVPFGLLPGIVRGRDQLLDRLQKQLREGGLVILTGPGGVGKSTIARELIRRAQTDHHRSKLQVWWLSGASPSALAAGLISVAQQLGAKGPDLQAIAEQTPDGPDRLWSLLEESPQRWLLVIDNADDPERLAAPAIRSSVGGQALVPTMAEGTGWARAGRRGLVLVTSRERLPARWGTAATLEPVDVLGSREAALVLLDLAPAAGEEAQANALARRLGGLPLALHLAGSYLGSEFARWSSFAAYIEALDREPTRALSAALEPGADERTTLTMTWELSLDALASRRIGQARALLRLLSCYQPAMPLPLDLLDDDLLRGLLGAARRRDDETAVSGVETGLRGLRSLGLVDAGRLPDSEIPAVVVHPVIAASNRVHLLHPQPADPEPGGIRRAAVAMIERAARALEVEQPGDWPRWRMLAPHIQALLEDTAQALDRKNLDRLVRMAERAVQALERMGAGAGAETLTGTALVAAERLGKGHPALLLVREHRAYQAGERGHWEEAETIFREVLEIRRRWGFGLGSYFPATFSTRHELARAAANQGRLQEAEIGFREVLQARRLGLGEDHPSTLTSRHEVAKMAAEQGRWAEAEAAFREVLEADRRVLGEDHPFTLTARHELARAIAGQGRLGEAETAFRNVLEADRRVLGDDHPSTLATRHNLAWAVADQGRWGEAETALREILAARRQVLGDDHPSTLTTCHHLASVVAKQGRWREAAAAFREVLDIERRVLGDEHPSTLATRSWVDECVRRQR
jgi:tetratricopeptide (TPR) repeat protein